MLAWMDEEALRRTRESGEAWFWSRSRQEYWHKGATSGNTLAVVEIRDDCDGDAILLRVDPAGPACHTGAESCFAPWLWRVVAERAATRPEGSYVARCSTQGVAAAAQKVGEEGVEAALAAVADSDERLVEELADLWFHSYVLLAARGLDPERVEEELRRRHAGCALSTPCLDADELRRGAGPLRPAASHASCELRTIPQTPSAFLARQVTVREPEIVDHDPPPVRLRSRRRGSPSRRACDRRANAAAQDVDRLVRAPHDRDDADETGVGEVESSSVHA